PLIASVLYPGAVDLSSGLIRISCLAIPAAGLAAAFGYALQATGEHRAAARRTSLLSVCGVVVTLACVWKWGLVGAVWAWVLKHVLVAAGLWRPFARKFSPMPHAIAKVV